MSAERIAAGTLIDAENPWPGLGSFDEGAQHFFSGRDAESAELLRLVSQAPLTVLFGKSGLGKTSLLEAGLFPRLRQQNILPVYIRLNMRDRSAPLIRQALVALQAEVGKHGVDTAAPEEGESIYTAATSSGGAPRTSPSSRFSSSTSSRRRSPSGRRTPTPSSGSGSTSLTLSRTAFRPTWLSASKGARRPSTWICEASATKCS